MADTIETKASILIVDDELCDGIRGFLEEEGYTVDYVQT